MALNKKHWFFIPSVGQLGSLEISQEECMAEGGTMFMNLVHIVTLSRVPLEWCFINVSAKGALCSWDAHLYGTRPQILNKIHHHLSRIRHILYHLLLQLINISEVEVLSLLQITGSIHPSIFLRLCSLRPSGDCFAHWSCRSIALGCVGRILSLDEGLMYL